MLPEPVTLREATIDDLPQILTFLGRKAAFDGALEDLIATPERLARSLFGDPPAAWIVFAEHDGKAVGFASYFFTYSTFLAQPGLWLDDLFIDDEFRRQGIGTLLLGYLAETAHARGCGRIEWTAASSNDRGIAFYRRLGATVRESTRLCRLDTQGIRQLSERFRSI